MLNGLFTDVLQSPGSCTLYIRLLCVLCVRMYVHMCVCSFVAVAHCLCCSTYIPTQHPPTRAHTHVSTHTQEQSILPSSAVEKKPFVPEAPPEG